jgi:hypothetical protein
MKIFETYETNNRPVISDTNRFKNARKSCGGYGATGKVNTLLNVSGVETTDLKYIAI